MKPWAAGLFALWLAYPAGASHQWAGIDLCEVYKDTLPPGLTPESLPEPQSSGAHLLQRYCTQCHNLPGPDRHSAGEWREVAGHMFMLMEVSHRFGGLMGRVETLGTEQQETLLAYLQRSATRAEDRDRLNGRGNNGHGLTSLWVLSPFLLLMGTGLARWWHRSHGKDRRCATR